MRKFIYLISAIATLWSCANELETIAEDFIGNGSSIELYEYRIDKTSTIKIDSFATSTGSNTVSLSEIFVGRYMDPLYGGETVVTPTFAIAPMFAPVIEEDATLDSVTFKFGYTGNLWGDTISLRQQELTLYEISELPTYDEKDDNGIMYNNKPIPPFKRELAKTYFLPNKQGLKDAYFKIDKNDKYFTKLFNRMKFNDNLFYDLPWSFIEEFKGLAITAGANNDVIFGIKAGVDSLYMCFHYHFGEMLESTFNIPLSTPLLQYFNATNTPTKVFESLKTQRDEVSFETASFSLIQGLSGYMVKMELPAPPPQDQFSTLVKAELEINPLVFYNSSIAMPQAIAVYKSNAENEVLGALTQMSGEVIGKLELNQENLDASRYIIDLTEFYDKLSNSPNFPEDSDQFTHIIISVNSMAQTFDRVIIEELPTLRLYYAHYNNDMKI